MPHDVKKDLEKCFYSFIWNSVDRIKRNTLVAEYKNGGLKMIDIECMTNAVKAAWIPRLLSIDKSQSIFFEYLETNCLSINLLVKGNIKDVKQFPNNVCLPDFYRECIISFNKCNNVCSVTNVHEFLTQPIWCNSNILINGQSICYRNWIDSGFMWIKDLYDENGSFIKSDIIYSRLGNKKNWISEYTAVRKAVGKIGRKYDNKYYAKYEHVDDTIKIKCKVQSYVISQQKSKFFYQLLVEKLYSRPYMENSWSKQFEKEIDPKKWENVYLRRIKGLPDKKLSEFVYKLISNLVVCRSVLFNWKRHETPKCPICGEIETV
jgi:hypothetical protein